VIIKRVKRLRILYFVVSKEEFQMFLLAIEFSMLCGLNGLKFGSYAELLSISQMG